MDLRYVIRIGPTALSDLERMFMATASKPLKPPRRIPRKRIQTRHFVERMEDACDRFDMMMTELKDLGKPTYSLAEARKRLGLIG